MHWADVIAEELLRKGDTHTIATGITPSGHIHVGNMREILTGDLIHRAMMNAGGNSTLYYLGDTFDPLRKVYPFLDKSFKQHIGRPLSEIPCPCGGHESYAVHFLEPFMESLDKLGVDYTPLMIHELYQQGKYAEGTRKVIDNREIIKEILERVSGRTLPKDWFPYTPKCEECGTFGAKVTGYEYPYVEYACDCAGNEKGRKAPVSHEGRSDIRKDDGKLPWRVDWPARWSFLGITCEPFGKDHGAAGGSYDTGSEIVEKIFDRAPPHPLMYEWIQLKGKGAMSSSTGVVVTGAEMLRMTPPEVLRFLIAKQNAFKHIDFDPGLGILNLVDEYDRYERIFHGLEDITDVGDMKRAYQLSDPHMEGSIPDTMALQVPYRHLVTLVQLTDSFEELKSRVMRTEGIDRFTSEAEERLLERVNCARYWVENMAPENVKFALQQKLPNVELNAQETLFLKALSTTLSGIAWEAENIHRTIYESASDIGAKKGFTALYKVFLGRNKGPRLGFFLSNLDMGFVLERLRQASDEQGSTK
jgi:lysyl-tRNA synthetase, class I